MSLAGHEDSGTVVETLDADLAQFLTSLTETKDELVVFLMADHGMRYGEWFKVLDGSHEHKLPALFLIASTSLLRDLPYAFDVVEHNARRLVSKMDLYATMYYLSELPYHRNFTPLTPLPIAMRTPAGSVILFHTKSSNFRTCDDLLIPAYYCSCLRFYPLATEVYRDPGPLYDQSAHDLVHYLAGNIVVQINDEVYTPLRPGFICQKLTLNRIETVEWQFLSSTKHYYKFVITVKESRTARFEATIQLSSQMIVLRSIASSYGVWPVFADGRRQFTVMYVKRLDEYAGVCEDFSKAVGLPSHLCICHPLDTLSFRHPAVYSSLLHHYVFALSSKGESCDSFCLSQGKLCSEKGLRLANTCKEMQKITRCEDCFEAENQPAFPGLRGPVCFISRKEAFLCRASERTIRRVCACVQPQS